MLRTSEFWVGLIAVILQFLVAKGVIAQSVSDIVMMMAVYVLGRLLSKAVKAIPTGGAQ